MRAGLKRQNPPLAGAGRKGAWPAQGGRGNWDVTVLRGGKASLSFLADTEVVLADIVL